jgi:transposase
LNSKLHAVADQDGKPLVLLLTEGQMSDHKGARIMLPALPSAKLLIADRGYDSDWFRQALLERRIKPCIPAKRNRKLRLVHDQKQYRRRYPVEIMFGRLKDWRRVATRYDRCAHTYFSAICIAAAVTYYLR